MKTFKPRIPLLSIIFGYTLLIRLLPYLLHGSGIRSLDPSVCPWNFSPIFAVCLFGGACFANRRLSIMLPLATMLCSDLGIWALTGRADWAFYSTQFSVYLSLAACSMIGFLLRDNRNVLKISAAGLAGCTLYFLVTNFACWAMTDMYPKTLAGMFQCYLVAIPYFRNSLLSTAFFGTILFSPLCLHLCTTSSQPVLNKSIPVG